MTQEGYTCQSADRREEQDLLSRVRTQGQGQRQVLGQRGDDVEREERTT